MKRKLLFFSFLLLALTGKAQTTFDVNSIEGYPLRYTIIDAVNRYVSVKSANTYYVPPFTTVTVPATVNKVGETEPYKVTEVAEEGFRLGYGNHLKHVILPEGIKRISKGAFIWCIWMEDFYYPSTLEEIGENAFQFARHLTQPNLDISNTKITALNDYVFWNNDNSRWTKEAKLPQTLQTIGSNVFGHAYIKTLEVPSGVHTISCSAFDYMEDLEEITFMNPTPATLTNPPLSGFLNNTNDKLVTIYVPVDATNAYQATAGWANHASKYREKVNIGATGYTTYYLENENFKVPTGCTAYIITGVTPSGSVTNPDQAVVKAFTAGKIIPKQTGFVLQGPANSTVIYEANVTGTEENVAGNLLIGTATEQQFSATGKRFYVLANGDQGMGFYKQGTRYGMSIKLKAHRAGLRLDESVARAKSIVFDFDAARQEAETTGIQNVSTNGEQQDDVVYDLQGRRVTNPTHGIYIINGKKVIK